MWTSTATPIATTPNSSSGAAASVMPTHVDVYHEGDGGGGATGMFNKFVAFFGGDDPQKQEEADLMQSGTCFTTDDSSFQRTMPLRSPDDCTHWRAQDYSLASTPGPFRERIHSLKRNGSNSNNNANNQTEQEQRDHITRCSTSLSSNGSHDLFSPGSSAQTLLSSPMANCRIDERTFTMSRLPPHQQTQPWNHHLPTVPSDPHVPTAASNHMALNSSLGSLSIRDAFGNNSSSAAFSSPAQDYSQEFNHQPQQQSHEFEFNQQQLEPLHHLRHDSQSSYTLHPDSSHSVSASFCSESTTTSLPLAAHDVDLMMNEDIGSLGAADDAVRKNLLRRKLSANRRHRSEDKKSRSRSNSKDGLKKKNSLNTRRTKKQDRRPSPPKTVLMLNIDAMTAATEESSMMRDDFPLSQHEDDYDERPVKPPRQVKSPTSPSKKKTIRTTVPSSSTTPSPKKKKAPRNRKPSPDRKIAVELRESDVLLGQGGESNRHPGNAVYREYIDTLRPKYEAASGSKTGIKQNICRDVVTWLKEERKGRFVKKDKKRQIWYEVLEQTALEKIGQAFREGKRKKKKKAVTPSTPKKSMMSPNLSKSS